MPVQSPHAVQDQQISGQDDKVAERPACSTREIGSPDREPAPDRQNRVPRGPGAEFGRPLRPSLSFPKGHTRPDEQRADRQTVKGEKVQLHLDTAP